MKVSGIQAAAAMGMGPQGAAAKTKLPGQAAAPQPGADKVSFSFGGAPRGGSTQSPAMAGVGGVTPQFSERTAGGATKG